MKRLGWLALVVLFACGDGEDGLDGQPGAEGPQGEMGEQGQDGQDGRLPGIVGPGLQLAVESATINETGTITVNFNISDEEGTPLDADGFYTEGAVRARFILASLAQTPTGEPLQYTAYTVRDRTSPITDVTETQASRDRGGTQLELGFGEGRYQYTFGTIATGVNPGLTHTVGVYATRDFQGQRYIVNEEFHFRPDGGEVTVTRDVVTNDACNTCHGQLAAHGSGSRQDVELCILCHSPQTVDPDTGNTTDFANMIHKIHRGSSLPSVINGTPYQIIGGSPDSIHDYSEVRFPQEIERCEACHQGAQGDYWQTRLTRAACLSCHDTTSFEDPPPAGMVLHGGGSQPEDSQCVVCHPPTGSIAPIIPAHLTPLTDPASPVVSLAITGITNTAPGQTPTMTFEVLVDGAPRDITSAPLDRLRATIAGPNTDYASYWQARIQGSGAVGTLVATDPGTGEHQYTFPAEAALPGDAEGSYTVGLEGRIEGAARFAAFSPVFPFAVTDATAVPRRVVVESARCNNCHYDLAFHGGGRKNPNYCVLCHNPNNPNEGRAPRPEDADILVESTDFKNMIHKIHAGSELTQDYSLGDFSFLEFPDRLNNCSACHADGTWRLPLADSLLPSIQELRTCTEDPAADADDECDDPFWVITQTIELPPVTSACTGCHDEIATFAHAEVMTTATGVESCAACHGPGAAFDIDIAHGL